MPEIVPSEEREHFTWRVVKQNVEVSRCAARLQNGQQCRGAGEHDVVLDGHITPLCTRHYFGAPFHTGRTDRSQ